MPMTQDDIRRHYEQEWKSKSDAAADASGLVYSNPVEDAVLYPAYARLIADAGIRVDGGRVLDVGSGSGRWIRFFLVRYRPSRLLGIDYCRSSVDLLETWHAADERVSFRRADITAPDLELDGPFDLVNVANVLFHIPEPDLFTCALNNLASLVAPDGRIVTTEYLPRGSLRTEWMMVRSRYEFKAAVEAAGLTIADVRAFGFFANDPVGLDGPDAAGRIHFHRVRSGMQQVLESKLDETSRRFFVDLLAEIEHATLAFARERIADIDLPSQKLVVLRRA